MDSEITPITNELLPSNPELARRVIADALRTVGMNEVLTADNKKVTYFEALARMLWQGAVEGIIYFADGATIEIPSLKEGPRVWMDLVKFVSQHLDGPAGANVNIGTANVFKVYQGFDPDKV